MNAVKLTPEEAALLKQIDFSMDGDALPSLRASAKLTPLLLARNAIPTIRLRYFTDPELNIGMKCSRQAVFERNGCTGVNIFAHGSFLSHLHYFIFGPDLPTDAISSFHARIVQCGGFVSGSDYPDLDSIVRDSIRRYALPSDEAAEEFYKLALECGVEPFMVRHFRDVAKKIRR